MESHEQDISQDELIVALGVFSGRPNPLFNMDREVAEQLAKMVKDVIGKELIHPPPRAKLGEFYGFFVKAPEELANSLGIPARIRIFHGVVTLTQGGEENHWRDIGNIADFLTRHAFEKGFGSFLEPVGIKRRSEETGAR